jgi:hypothetical protein
LFTPLSIDRRALASNLSILCATPKTSYIY